ncbi:MAG TPA: cache domain-containing protein, partial [Acetobacteraceae bacterium]|nr:cache domain-containing protein [Acetobacteraceae bacterium]
MNTGFFIARTDRSSRNPAFLVRLFAWLTEQFSLVSETAGATDGTRPQPPQPRGKPAAMLLAGQIAIGLAIAVTAGLLIMHLRHNALTQATLEQQRLSLILTDQAERALEAVELVQNGLVDQLQRDTVHTPAAFRQYMSGDLMQSELSSRGGMLPQLDAITIVDSHGNLINSSDPILGLAINVADREYFTVLRDDPGRTMFISQPLQNRRNGKWSAYIARKVTGPDGEFLGLILGSMRLRYFEELYHAASLGPDATITLRRQDGILLARDPHVDLGLALAASIRLQSPKPVEANGITYWHVSPIDGQDRLIVERSLLQDTMVVGVTNTTAAVLADWHRQASWLIAAAIVLEFVVAGAGLLVLRQLRNQHGLGLARAARRKAEAARKAAEASLAVARERSCADRALGIQNLRFEAALSNMLQALFMFDASGRLVVVNGRAAEMFGVPPASIALGMTVDEVRDLCLANSNLQPEDVEA